MQIHTIDLHFQNQPQIIAAYLVVGDGGPVLIETGPGSTLPQALTGLAALGYRPADIPYVLVTHIHLDHAGAAGWWAQQGARVFVHHRGAPHLVDPSRLLESAGRIYGDQMDVLWGETRPAPAGQVVALRDNERLTLNGLEFEVLETPGHAGHHHAFRLGSLCFTGDAVGISTPGNAAIGLPAPPPEFDREAWLTSLDRLATEHFEAIYPTHFGRYEDVDRRLALMRRLVDTATDEIGRALEAGQDPAQIGTHYRDWYRAWMRREGASAALLQVHEVVSPLEMSVSGILRYWRRRHRAAAASS